jgi:hypothetical protein
MDAKSYNIRVPKRWARLTLIVGVTALIVAPLTAVATHTFNDVPDTHTFHADIEWLEASGVTKGCNPPANTLFCPDDDVTRGQMAAFMKRFSQYLGAEDGTPAQADNATTADLAMAVADGSVDSDALADDEGLHLVGTAGEPAFENAWVNFGTAWSRAGFYKDLHGVVHLTGTITGGASASTAFTLPDGYRPSRNLFLPVANGDFLFVRSNGAVQATYAINTSNGDIGLDGLSFRVGAGTASAPSDDGDTPGS